LKESSGKHVCIAQKQEEEVARPPFFTYFRGAWKKINFPEPPWPIQSKIKLNWIAAVI
jgi:hypothetical protein